MMSYIRSRSGITGSTHLLYNIGFTFAGNQENDTLRVYYRTSRHCYTFLPVIRVIAHFIYFIRRQQTLLSRKNRRSMSIPSCSQSYHIKHRPTVCHRSVILYHTRITDRFFFRSFFSLNTKYVFIRNRYHTHQ